MSVAVSNQQAVLLAVVGVLVLIGVKNRVAALPAAAAGVVLDNAPIIGAIRRTPTVEEIIRVVPEDSILGRLARIQIDLNPFD